MRGTRQLPTEHIQLAMVIKKRGTKTSYTNTELSTDVESGGNAVDILGCISVKRKAGNEIIQRVKCSKLWTGRAIIFTRPSMTAGRERQQGYICLNSLRHM